MMKNNLLFVLLLFCFINNSSCNKQINKDNFEGFSWNTTKENIESVLGKPLHSMEFEQYNTITEYLYFNFKENFGYNTLPYFAFINNRLVGGGYIIGEAIDEDILELEYSYEKYIDIQKKFTNIYDKFNITSEIFKNDLDIPYQLFNNALEEKNNIPDMNIITLDELKELCPFWTYWERNGDIIKLSLNYDEGFLITVDVLGPKLTEGFDEILLNEIEKAFNELE